MFPFSRKTSWNYYRPRHTMRQIAATRHGDKSPRLHCCCDQSLALSLSLRYVAQIQTSLNLCDRSQRQWFSHVIQGDLLQQPVAAICRIVCLGLNSCEVPGYPAVKLSSTNFRQIFLVVLPGKGHSSSMTLKLSFAEKMTLFANLVIELKCQNVEHLPFGILETTVKKWSSKPYLLFAAILWTHMAFQSRAMSHWNVM